MSWRLLLNRSGDIKAACILSMEQHSLNSKEFSSRSILPPGLHGCGIIITSLHGGNSALNAAIGTKRTQIKSRIKVATASMQAPLLKQRGTVEVTGQEVFDQVTPFLPDAQHSARNVATRDLGSR